MTYGHKSSLWEQCSWFLWFAYLVDFLSLKALSNIYLNSVKDMINWLWKLDTFCNIDELMAAELDESKAVTTAIRGQDPIFDVKLTLIDNRLISENEITH